MRLKSECSVWLSDAAVHLSQLSIKNVRIKVDLYHMASLRLGV